MDRKDTTDLNHLDAWQYHLPPELIAQHPAERRDGSRMLVFSRTGDELEHRQFSDLVDLLTGDELLVLNDSRVVPARFRAEKPTGGRVEVLGLGPWDGPELTAMVKASKPPRPGSSLRITRDGPSKKVEIIEAYGQGRFRLRLIDGERWMDVAEAFGEVPLPPYIRRDSGSVPGDRDRYQTVFARDPGSVAAPTAGLHFTDDVLAAVRRRGVEIARVTLHVGPGTFLPVRTDDIREHRMHSETWRISPETAGAIRAARAEGRPVLAVGTTVVRTLEGCAAAHGQVTDGFGSTDIFIHPPYNFQVVDQLLTNFHLPGSTLLMLVGAFCGRDRVLGAYAEAVRQGYRFFSYGDCSLIR